MVMVTIPAWLWAAVCVTNLLMASLYIALYVHYAPIVEKARGGKRTNECAGKSWDEKMRAVGPHLAGRDTAFVEAVRAKMLRGHVEHGQTVEQLVDAGEYTPELLDAFVYPSLYEWAGRITPALAQKHREAAYAMWQDLQRECVE